MFLVLMLLGIAYGASFSGAHATPQRLHSSLLAPDVTGRVTVYLLHLPDVPTAWGNFSNFREGVADAIQNRTVSTNTIYGTRSASLTFLLIQITDWQSYRNLILNEDNFILVNAHGSYLPVPTGYTSNQWFDHVLTALSSRFVTWTHVAGFPFYQAWNEGIGSTVLGPSLFLRLASFARWPATITGNPAKTPGNATDYFQAIEEQLWEPRLGWSYGFAVKTTGSTDYSFAVPETSRGPWLHGFYEARNGTTIYYSGVVARVNGTSPGSYGLYAHFVPGTFGFEGGGPSAADLDYARGVLGILMPIEWQVLETASSIELADSTVQHLISAGQTDGLNPAEIKVASAKSKFASGQDLSAWFDASVALVLTGDARTPWLVTALPYLELFGGIGVVWIILGFGATIPAMLGSTVGRASRPREGPIARIRRFLRRRWLRSRL